MCDHQLIHGFVVFLDELMNGIRFSAFLKNEKGRLQNGKSEAAHIQPLQVIRTMTQKERNGYS